MAKKQKHIEPETPLEESLPFPIVEEPDYPPEREKQEETLSDMGGGLLEVADIWGTVQSAQNQPRAPIESTSVDDYLRKQVIRDIYGKDDPSDYDIYQQALKKLL